VPLKKNKISEEEKKNFIQKLEETHHFLRKSKSAAFL